MLSELSHDEIECIYAPVGGFLVYLAQGWKLPAGVFEPMHGHHGTYSTLLWRPHHEDKENG